MNATQIKILLFVLMVLNHFCVVFKGNISHELYLIIGYVSRVVAPVFWFLSVESYYKTQRKKRYLVHLFSFAILMSVGNYALNALFVGNGLPAMQQPFNIFWSLALGVAMIAGLEQSKNPVLSGHAQSAFFILASMAWCSLLFVEGDVYAMVAYPIFYWFWGQKKCLYIAYALACLCLLVYTYYTQDGFFQDGQYGWLMVLAIAWFWAYNGRRGSASKLAKYFFYIGYPLHAWLLYVVWAFQTGSPI